jgi:hypothetical protein
MSVAKTMRSLNLTVLGCSYALLLALTPGCMANRAAQRGYPLYAGTLPPDQVARLQVVTPGGAVPGSGATSFIKTVDGRDVSTLDSLFELLPGCHLVSTERSLLVGNENVTVRADLGTRVLPFRMKAGYEYAVVVEFGSFVGSTARASISAVERDPAGKQTETVPPATSLNDLSACKAWHPTPQ